MREQAKKIYLEFLSGKSAAFPELVRLLTPRFYRMFRHLGADQYEAEDCCQDFFLAIFRSGGSYDRTRDFLPWAYMIARHLYFRSREASKIKIIPIFESLQAAEVQRDDTGICELLALLSEEKRAVFELKHFQDLKFQEIAEVLEIPVGTVKSRMFAAVSELGEIMKRRET
ncbi:MAG: RNA polymerase sigma factor [Candidatus Wallbacteria bacterium]|nr:RNA polymerase sigma factor [Candidatus Wallbacteria bacterium]